jgi:hypothetical protein
METLRAKLRVVNILFPALFLGASFVLLAVVVWDQSQAKKFLAIAEKEQIQVEENSHRLQAWVDDDPRAQWQKEYEEELIPEPLKNIDGDEVLPAPPTVDMKLIKNKGCVADGFLSGYGGDINSSIALINRSQCYYLHRALETWLKPPDFALARDIKTKVTKPNTVYGMFIAEAISTKKDYYNPNKQRPFDFDKMCASGTKNDWGEHTCKPSLAKEEYRDYVEYITEAAMDMGVQVFLFGQVFYQDNPDPKVTKMPKVIEKMREHAKERNLQIIIGAQTNDISDENYLRLFDFIEGGVGLRSNGSVENNACFSRWYKKPGDWCWALLWHPSFKSKANNVLVHFDWSGKIGDDMSVFTRMEKEKRAETVARLHQYFTSQDVGFLVPMLATLHQENGGCHGKKKRFYSAARKYSCQDEEVINGILQGSF